MNFMLQTRRRRFTLYALTIVAGMVVSCLVLAVIGYNSNQKLPSGPEITGRMTPIDKVRLAEALHLKAELGDLDARARFSIKPDEDRKRAGEMPPGCDCARVVLGKIYPNQCRLYGKACTPRTPIGPCMVSDEGACRIWWAGGIRESAA